MAPSQEYIARKILHRADWLHNDSKGFNLQIDCVPLDGRITLRVIEDDKE